MYYETGASFTTSVRAATTAETVVEDVLTNASTRMMNMNQLSRIWR